MSDSLKFNGQDNSDTVKRYNTKYQTNPNPCPANYDRINYGRGPTKAGTTGDSVPNPTAATGRINGGATVKPAKGNYGRGPTKGNQ